MDHGVRSRFEMVSGVIIDVDFGDLFNVCGDCDKYRFL